MSVRRGGALENSILRASRGYRRAGRKIVLLKQEPRTAYVNGGVQEVGAAPVDFLGALETRSLAIEAKSTKGKSLAIDRLRDDQISLLGLLCAAGADVRLIVWFTDLDEHYSVAWQDVATFLAFAYRQSFPRCWFVVHGLRLPTAGEDERREVLFLDGYEGPDRGKALEELERDKARPRAERVEEEPVTPRPSPYRGLNAEQIRERLNAAMQVGLERQMKTQKRQWKRRRSA